MPPSSRGGGGATTASMVRGTLSSGEHRIGTGERDTSVAAAVNVKANGFVNGASRGRHRGSRSGSSAAPWQAHGKRNRSAHAAEVSLHRPPSYAAPGASAFAGLCRWRLSYCEAGAQTDRSSPLHLRTGEERRTP